MITQNPEGGSFSQYRLSVYVEGLFVKFTPSYMPFYNMLECEIVNGIYCKCSIQAMHFVTLY